jgi:glycosyltransferase involved in cell wall biosynthesis
MPLVSIVTPIHNKGPFIEATLASVIAQSFTDWELIVVENHSKDDGPSIVNETASSERRIQLVDASSHVQGPSAARNAGLEKSTGRWILHLDADDLLEANYLEQKLKLAYANPMAEIIAGGWQEFFDGCEEPCVVKQPSCWRKSQSRLLDSAFAFAPWAVHAALIQKEVVLKCGGWPEEMDALASEDNVFWFRAIFSSRVEWDQSHGALYRKATPGCRDMSGGLSVKARIALATLRWNSEFLRSRGKKVTPGMHAMAFRVLRNLLSEMDKGNSQEFHAEIFNAMRWHLKMTSWFDFRMVFNRLFKNR